MEKGRGTILFERLFESPGIDVWVENGKIIIADEQEREELPDTPENREIVLRAQKIVKEWENERG